MYLSKITARDFFFTFRFPLSRISTDRFLFLPHFSQGLSGNVATLFLHPVDFATSCLALLSPSLLSQEDSTRLNTKRRTPPVLSRDPDIQIVFIVS